jgi:hypothetical protein
MTAAPFTIHRSPVTSAPRFIFPARPINGGPLDKARPKYGTNLWEPKLNGWRSPIHAPSRTMWNRHGDLLTIAAEFDEALDRLANLSEQSGIDLWDCEALERRHGIGRGSLYVLDWIPLDVGSSPTLSQRSALLDEHLGRLPYDARPHEGGIYRPDAVPGDLTTWAELQRISREWNPGGNPANDFYEGLVAKRLDSPYPLHHTNAAQTFPQWMKHRWAF